MLSPQPHQSLADAVADRLRAAIDAGAYRPGARLVERSLSRELGVSHIPVREALTRLEEEGLVVRLPRRGARVAALSARDLEEISSLRVLLEGFVVKRVQAAWSPAVALELEGLVARMLDAAGRSDIEALVQLDRRFHERLWQLADHALLVELAAQLRGRINRFLRAATAALDPDALRAHAETHRTLVEALASGAPAVAERAMRDHIETAAARIIPVEAAS